MRLRRPCSPPSASNRRNSATPSPRAILRRDIVTDQTGRLEVVEYTLARASQLRGDLEAIGPRLTREDVVVGIRRGPIALGEDVLDIELRLPGLGDLRVDAGVEAQEARQVDAVVGRRVRIREVDGAEPGGPDRIDLILVPPRELMERDELNAVAARMVGEVSLDTRALAALAKRIRARLARADKGME